MIRALIHFNNPFYGANRPVVWLAVGSLAVFLAYNPILKAGFLNWDDDRHILENPAVQKPLPAAIKDILFRPVNKTHIPLTQLTWALEKHLFGLNPFIFHLNNLLLHLLVMWLIYALGRSLLLPPSAAVAAAIIFALHPMHVESVAWATARKDLLYSVFYITSLFTYIRWVRTKRPRFYWASLAAAFLSVAAKPMALSLPWVLWLIDWLIGRPFSRQVILDKLPFFFIVEPIAFATYWLNKRHVLFFFPESVLLWIWCAVSPLVRFFIPLNLSPLYTAPRPISFSQPSYAAAVLFAALILTLMWRNRHKKWLVFPFAYYAASNFFLWRFDLYDINVVADRFLYLPSLGFCLALGRLWGFWRGCLNPSQRWKASFAAALWVLAASLLTVQQCRIWQDPLTFWNYVIRRAEHHPLARHNQALALSSRNIQEGVEALNRLVTDVPSYPLAYYNLGRLYEKLGERQKAFQSYDRVIALHPQLAVAYNNRGNLWMDIDPRRALEDFDKAVRLKPDYAYAHYNRGNAFYRMGRFDEAIEAYNIALRLKPDFIGAFINRGNTYLELHKIEKALEDYERVLEIDPTNTAAWNNKGHMLFLLKRYDEAEEALKKALTYDPYHVKAKINLSRVYFIEKKYDEALQWIDAALEQSPQDLLALNIKAHILYKLNRYEEALAVLETLVFLEPRHAEAHYNRALLLEKLGHLDEARAALKEAKQMGYPIDETVWRRLFRDAQPPP